MHHLTNLANALFENPVCGRVGDHHCRQIIRVLAGFSAEIVQVDITFLAALHRYYLHAGQHRTCRIRAVRAGGNQAHLPMLLIAALVIMPDHQ